MNKAATKHCLSLFVCLFAWVLFVSAAWGACSGERIGYETQQMQVGATQTLTVTGARPEASYRWRVASGGGTLSATTGASVVYTAPSSNPNCENNPVITLSSDGAACETLQIAVSAPRIDGGAFFEARTFSKTSCTHSIYKRPYDCNGSSSSEWSACDGCDCNPGWPTACNCNGAFLCTADRVYDRCSANSACGSWNGVTIACGGVTDIRTAAQKAKGCCPAALLPAEPPPPACDVSVTSFGGTSTAIDVHNGGRVVFTGTIASSDPVSWTVSVAGKTIGEGTGLAVSVPWDGRLDGQVAEIGRTWPVKLVVETTDGRCSNERETTVIVTASEKDCKIQVEVGSSAHLQELCTWQRSYDV